MRVSDWPGCFRRGRNRRGRGYPGSGPRRSRRRLQLEALEHRLAPASYYWQLESNSPTVDPAGYQAGDNYSTTQSDPDGASVTDTSILTISHSSGQDSLDYSLVQTGTPPTAGGTAPASYTDETNMTWSGAPGRRRK